jgi:hypothetical protein
MKHVTQYHEARDDSGKLTGANVYAVCVIAALSLAAAFGLSSMIPRDRAAAERASLSAATSATWYQVILDALLVPSLQADAVPLRFVDPRASLRCGSQTAVRVNHQALVPGALVPDTPFELEWRADGCHPFGAQDARIDGWVTLTVFREDWGFSAIVQPSGLRIASAGYERALVQRGSAWLPQCGESAEPLMPTHIDDRESPPCL